MLSINQVQHEINRLLSSAEDCIRVLDREGTYIAESMNIAQRLFGDQEAGQRLVLVLSHSMKNAIGAAAELHQFASDAQRYSKFLSE